MKRTRTNATIFAMCTVLTLALAGFGYAASILTDTFDDPTDIANWTINTGDTGATWAVEDGKFLSSSRTGNSWDSSVFAGRGDVTLAPGWSLDVDIRYLRSGQWDQPMQFCGGIFLTSNYANPGAGANVGIGFSRDGGSPDGLVLFGGSTQSANQTWTDTDARDFHLSILRPAGSYSLYATLTGLDAPVQLTFAVPAATLDSAVYPVLWNYNSVMQFDNLVITAVPEPGSLAALLAGLFGFAAAGLRRRK